MNEQIKASIQVFDSHTEADWADVQERASMSYEERMKLYASVQRRFWGDEFPNFSDRPSLRDVGFTGVRDLHDHS